MMNSNKTNSIDSALAKFSFGVESRTSLYRKIAAFLSNGEPIHDVIKALKYEYYKLNKRDFRVLILGGIEEDMSYGSSFSEAISKWVPASELLIIKAGEESSDLSSAMKDAVEVTMATKQMKSAVFGKMAYPTVLMLLFLVLMFIFSTTAIPQISATLDPKSWPPLGQMLYGFSTFIQNYWLHCIVAFTVTSIMISKTMPTYTGRWRKYLDKLPPWSIYQTMQSSTFLLAVAAMLKSGTPISESLHMMRDNSEHYVSKQIQVMIDKLVIEAETPGEAMRTSFLDVETGVDIAIYDKSNSLETALDSIGREAIHNGIGSVSKASAIANVVVLLSIGLYVGVTYFAIFQITQAAQTQMNMM
ncbi:type II secretion system F family protein [Vibrio splendidus]